MERLLKRNSLLKIVNSYIYDSLLSININYFYNFGSLLGLFLVIQIISGILLAFYYTAHIDWVNKINFDGHIGDFSIRENRFTILSKILFSFKEIYGELILHLNSPPLSFKDSLSKINDLFPNLVLTSKEVYF